MRTVTIGWAGRLQPEHPARSQTPAQADVSLPALSKHARQGDLL
jgi:hypothetical protein